MAEGAKADGIPVRGYISTAIACPYEGPIAPAEVARVTGLLFGLGCYEVSLGDTIGQGTPETVAAMLDAVLAVAPPEKLAGHYHDTNGRALESVAVSIEKGLRVFDAAVGGLGGCPYAPGAKGNLASGAPARDLARRVGATALSPDARAAAGHCVRHRSGWLS